MLVSMMKVAILRTMHSLATLPTRADASNTALFLLSIMGASFVWGVTSGLLQFRPVKDSRAIGWLLAYLTGRTFVEELLFRSMLLPHPAVDGAISGWQAVTRASALPVLFAVLSHLFTTRRAVDEVAIDAPFLLLVTAVNIVQAIAYQLSSGSFIVVWASHLALALPYLLYAGGYKKMHIPPTLKRTAPQRPGTEAEEPAEQKTDKAD